ncbi:MAG TPA: hypothetical protein VHQ92_13425 [Pseudolabrys sp.]|jgi:hypothetical protein|nr:hypothetical protein [Pseudolabrys sp.]
MGRVTHAELKRRTVEKSRDDVPVKAVGEPDVVITLRTSEKRRHELKGEALRRRTSVQAMIFEAIDEYLKKP